MDNDFDAAAEAGEEVHEGLDGETSEAVTGERGDFGLVDAEMAGCTIRNEERSFAVLRMTTLRG